MQGPRANSSNFAPRFLSNAPWCRLIPLSQAVDRWMQNSDVVDSTRDGYENYIERYIRRALGSVAVRKADTRTLERFYADLRRCRIRCNNKLVEHRVDGEHDCGKSKCAPHSCRPLAKSTASQIHLTSSGSPAAAERWGWIDANAARIPRRPSLETV